MGGVVKDVANTVGGFVEDVTGINLGDNSRSDRALRAQQQAAQDANRVQLEMFNMTREDLAPYRQAGVPAIERLQANDFMKGWQTDPGYQFRMQEGMRALQNSAAARGALNSGATLKALTRYGQDLAAQEYANIYNREFNRLSNLANIGQNSAAMTGQAGQNYAQAYGQNVTGAANAQAAQAIAQANQLTQLLQGGAQAAAMAKIFSDARLKTDIRPVEKADLDELRRAIKPYHFRYVSEQFGDGEWVGVMAQDLEKTKLGKTVVFEDEQGRKLVHLQKLLSLLVTTFAEEAA